LGGRPAMLARCARSANISMAHAAWRLLSSCLALPPTTGRHHFNLFSHWRPLSLTKEFFGFFVPKGQPAL
jgi:hypothetical protein